MALDLEQKQLLSKALLLGSGTAIPIMIGDREALKLVQIAFNDLGFDRIVVQTSDAPPDGIDSYFDIPLGWFYDEEKSVDFLPTYERAIADVPDFQTYFKCLCELHKRRRKYDMILKAQPLPTALQVAPRSLLEFGKFATPALTSWMTWRKWIYDIDNRAAQETGYLFEPILASALGGASYGARNSPVRRRTDQRKGRQVDCVMGSDAYEFKLRVTIAASGQGRFTEELDFAEDCVHSGFRPILLVLDPTPSSRLDDLSRAFRAVGGEAYVGDAAWDHIEARSGPTMATFVEKYVRTPISALDQHMTELLDLHICADPASGAFKLTLGDNVWMIERREDPILAEADDEA